MIKENTRSDIKEEDVIKKRIEYIDIFRAIGIICMIMGHIGFTDKFDFIIHAFNMPMFFFISGLFYKKQKDVKTFIIKKCKTLLVPYVVFGLFHYILSIILIFKKTLIEPLYILFWKNTYGIPIAGALWFLTSLFFTEIIYLIIDNITSEKKKATIVVIISLLGNFERILLPFRLPLGIGAAFTGIAFFYLGNIIKRNDGNRIVKKITNLNLVENLILAIIVYKLIEMNTYVDMRTVEYGIVPLFWINSILSIICLINLSKHIERAISGRLKQYLMSVGRNSIIYVCLNQIIIILIKVIALIIINLQNIYVDIPLLTNSVVLIVVLAILYLLSQLIVDTKLRIIIGKW